MNQKPDQPLALSLGYSNTPPKLGEVTLAWESDMSFSNTETSLTSKLAPRNYHHTPEQIAQEIRVDEAGNLWWAKPRKGRKFYNKPLGTVNKDGYLVIGLDYHLYYNHAICFCLYYKRWPDIGMVVDHINRVKTDNRKENLRETTHSRNMSNAVKPLANNKSGYRNISLNNGYWEVQIVYDKIKDCKRFNNITDAIKYRNNHPTWINKGIENEILQPLQR